MRHTSSLSLSAALLAAVVGSASSTSLRAEQPKLTVSLLGTYKTGVFDEGAAEIVAHDAKNQRLYIVNGHDKAIDVIDFRDPKAMTKLMAIPVKPYGKTANSVAVHGDILAAAIESDPKQAPGKLVFFDLEGKELAVVELGALPDMVAFTPDGQYVLVANEGEPSDDYKTDPEGSISIVTVADKSVRTISFAGLDKAAFGASAHFPSPAGTSLAQDLEPEYIAVTPDSKVAFVTLQENNAMAVIDIANASLVRVFGLGLKDFSKFAFDLSDKDGAVSRKPWPVKAMFQPDSVVAFEHGGQAYAVIANEGDARDYEGYSEETRVAKLKLDPNAFPNAAELQDDKMLGRLKTTKARGDSDGDGDHDEIYAFGGRSFSIVTANGEMVFDSGDEFSRILSERHPTWFNSEGQEDNVDGRSDDKGAEPEGVAIGMVGDRRYAFIGLERMGGVMIYDISDPATPSFVDYVFNADPKGDAKAGTAGDVAPEGLAFIAAANSPTGNALLVVANEVSGSTTAFEIK